VAKLALCVRTVVIGRRHRGHGLIGSSAPLETITA
jgi:hypothetical protein